ncbi:Hypothetical protein GbCGDNIH2_0547 [Granulibacter bethesdensis]|uniref:Uncharacterized protein n=2 Tax=Granulibacter bethesdensis TaxID=364410 RepID=Q0BUQ7_GRABC|nr:Hypothetical protein GbCGDNIH1_0547 [Granulibacter bethesdensis CGDNIH1]AHJ62322.1 Hypothetical protein GbCGDNIH3_0547 [Granulibacter bethesdensis]AHJ64952.1 Hypothetical protein GbCGDNIH4_0547 [Granulibacter bethesdensis CGDNIH4]AHJ67574.1 Hypothetical protein GbCGDNIH2_0547 [Granulibacter bethesdensis]APH51239.1 Hypothetical protein GbCGDNIH5_0547 [Granulibacter bethesdensis]
MGGNVYRFRPISRCSRIVRLFLSHRGSAELCLQTPLPGRPWEDSGRRYWPGLTPDYRAKVSSFAADPAE